MSPWFFNIFKNEEVEVRRMGVRFLEEGREWKLLGLLYVDNFVLCSEL